MTDLKKIMHVEDDPSIQTVARVALEAVGGYDESMPIWEDYELWLRLGLRFRLRNLRGLMTAYRIHAGNVSGTAGARGTEALARIRRTYGGSYPLSWILGVKTWLKQKT